MSEKIIRVGVLGQGRSGYDIHVAWLRQARSSTRWSADCRPDARTSRGGQGSWAPGPLATTANCSPVATWRSISSSTPCPVTCHTRRRHRRTGGGLPCALRETLCPERRGFRRHGRGRDVGPAGDCCPSRIRRHRPAFRKIQEVLGFRELGRLVHARIVSAASPAAGTGKPPALCRRKPQQHRPASDSTRPSCSLAIAPPASSLDSPATIPSAMPTTSPRSASMEMSRHPARGGRGQFLRGLPAGR